MLIAIIGSAGRKEDARFVSKPLYIAGVRAIKTMLEKDNVHFNATLVSGGAAFVDHMAVTLFKQGWNNCKLSLHLPAPWDFNKNRFIDTPSGSVANYYHEMFSQAVDGDTLAGLGEALKMEGCSHWVYSGFRARNLHVAKAEYICALTFNPLVPKPGSGTEHTWTNSRAGLKRHIDLGELYDNLRI